MATLKWSDGFNEYLAQLSKLSDQSLEICKAAVYDGAGVVADAVREGVRSIPINNGYGTTAMPIDGVTAKQKAGLLEGLGISPMEEENGYVHVKIGFDGYNSLKTKKYPNGQPNSLIMRAVESGTSFRAKNPVVSKATRSAKEKAEEAMRKSIDASIEKIMK